MPEAAAAGAAPAPLDLVCGTLVPVRWSRLCVLYRYEHAGACAADAAEDKIFEMDVIVQTTRGAWDFRGRRGRERVEPGTLVSGVRGRGYGCRHDLRFPDANVIASLRDGAVDGDDPLFDVETQPLAGVPSLAAALAAPTTGAFDSRVFETFDAVSARSRRFERRRRFGRIRIERAKRFIEDRADGAVTLADVATSVGLSPFTLMRQFKAHAGVTPHAYLAALRLARARKLLADTSQPVAAVAAAVGIDDAAYFSRWFARATGVPPRTYRAATR